MKFPIRLSSRSMIDPKKISIQDYTYQLPESKIAQFPLNERADSKLLVLKADGEIEESNFKNIITFLPENSLLLMNNSRVVRARLIFQKETGANIEVFCLEPADGLSIDEALKNKEKVSWLCMVGNAKKWKEEILNIKLTKSNTEYLLHAKKTGEEDQLAKIEFSWTPSQTDFAEMISLFGNLPLPPYMKRKAEEEDSLRYNTVYAKVEGSVAAPTSGLHFTDQVLNSLQSKNIKTKYLTLHVGAGTFKPVKAANMEGHLMHTEEVNISLDCIESVYAAAGKNKIVAVGTTTLRTLESVYWFAVKLISGKGNINDFEIKQWEPYEYEHVSLPSGKDALKYLIAEMNLNNLDSLRGNTGIIIAPGYKIKMIDALITNFHQPESTLLLLVASLTGKKWKTVYNYALQNDFRFLSYGDSSLLFKQENV